MGISPSMPVEFFFSRCYNNGSVANINAGFVSLLPHLILFRNTVFEAVQPA